MINTGIIRKVDELGRIVIPVEIRNDFNINEGEYMEIHVEGTCIILKKHMYKCTFCGNTENLEEFKEKFICQKCKDSLNKNKTA